jgi:mono/diheme cytochrome c family protein
MKHLPLACIALAGIVAGCTGNANQPAENPTGSGSSAAGTSEPATVEGNENATTVAFADVKKILDTRCVGCHGENGKEGIDLRSYESIMRGGEHGKILEPGKSADSEIVKAIEGTDGHKRMPLNMPPLSDDEIAQIKSWIDAGAKP